LKKVEEVEGSLIGSAFMACVAGVQTGCGWFFRTPFLWFFGFAKLRFAPVLLEGQKKERNNERINKK
jgi:hypothetical protein